MKRALITGITGQDGSYLAEILLDNGYEVHGIKRRSSGLNTARIDHLYQDRHIENSRLRLHYGDVQDAIGLARIIQEIEPDEIYHLAAMSHVRVSFDVPEYTAQVNALPIVTILETVRRGHTSTRVYNASTSELFGNSTAPQNEKTPFKPASPYGVSKLFAHEMVRTYREAYGLFVVNGILFNHESPRRGETFVSRKITRGLAQMLAGKTDTIHLGNLDAVRDWGHARDMMQAAYLLLQQPTPNDRVVATGTGHTVRQLVETAFGLLGVQLNFDDAGATVSHCADARFQLPIGHRAITLDPFYLRPLEVPRLIGDSSLFKSETGWEPTTNFEALIREMVAHDLWVETDIQL